MKILIGRMSFAKIFSDLESPNFQISLKACQEFKKQIYKGSPSDKNFILFEYLRTSKKTKEIFTLQTNISKVNYHFY